MLHLEDLVWFEKVFFMMDFFPHMTLNILQWHLLQLQVYNSSHQVCVTAVRLTVNRQDARLPSSLPGFSVHPAVSAPCVQTKKRQQKVNRNNQYRSSLFLWAVVSLDSHHTWLPVCVQRGLKTQECWLRQKGMSVLVLSFHGELHTVRLALLLLFKLPG